MRKTDLFKRIAFIMLAALITVTPMSYLTGCGNKTAVEANVDDETDEDD